MSGDDHFIKPAAQWRAFYNVSYPKLWGIETTDPAAIDVGLEIIVAPCMPEHAAKDIAEAWNARSEHLSHVRQGDANGLD